MEITKSPTADGIELKVTGRLDGYWAEHLGSELDEVVRGGAHKIRLDLSGVTFLSSAGIRVLLQYYKKLKAIEGSLIVDRPSQPVKAVLALSGLGMLLDRPPSAATAAPVVAPATPQKRSLESAHGVFELFEPSPGATLTCRTVGDPSLLDGCRFTEKDCQTVPLPDGTFAVGLGAFGGSFAECQSRFGEFLAASGAATYLPTDGTNVPDYLVATGSLVPEMRVCYGIVCEGTFGHLLRFEAKKDVPGVPISELIETALGAIDGPTAGLVIAAEAAGLVGAALRRSPAMGGATATAPFQHPEIREWITFTTERAYGRSLALLAGIVTTRPENGLMAFMRPIRNGSNTWGHVHAAAFSYRPLQKGAIDLHATVVSLFDHQTLQGLMHLLADDREIAGVGESELIRGACWVGRVS